MLSQEWAGGLFFYLARTSQNEVSPSLPLPLVGLLDHIKHNKGENETEGKTVQHLGTSVTQAQHEQTEVIMKTSRIHLPPSCKLLQQLEGGGGST